MLYRSVKNKAQSVNTGVVFTGASVLKGVFFLDEMNPRIKYLFGDLENLFGYFIIEFLIINGIFYSDFTGLIIHIMQFKRKYQILTHG